MVSYQLGLEGGAAPAQIILFPEDLVARTHREFLRRIGDGELNMCVANENLAL